MEMVTFPTSAALCGEAYLDNYMLLVGLHSLFKPENEIVDNTNPQCHTKHIDLNTTLASSLRELGFAKADALPTG